MLAVKYMSKENGGHGGILVNVSERMNVGNTAQLPVYAATKHAIIGLSQSLAVSSIDRLRLIFLALNLNYILNRYVTRNETNYNHNDT